MFDVVVIGGGLAGVTAALYARSRGASVALASRSFGATALSSGALDVAFSPALSPAAQTPRTIAEHVMDIIAHRPRHPYGVLGLELTLSGLRRGWELVQPVLRAAGLDPGELDLEADNLSVPSSLGALLPAAAVMAPHQGLDFGRSSPRRLAVVQLEGDAQFDARRVSRGVAHDAAALSSRGWELTPVPVAYGGKQPPLGQAMELDDAQAQDRLARELSQKAGFADVLLLPPVLGLERHELCRRRLSEAVGKPVVEALAHLPSVPGVRLTRALVEAVRRARIELVGEIQSPVIEGRRVVAVRTADALTIRGGAFVLATGRFISGGVSFDERCREVLFGLPTVTELGALEEDSPHGVIRETPMESHPLMAAGVQVGRDLKPMAEGHAAYDNLFGAGMILGGFASRYALCADGVALASGVVAAEGALAAAERA